MLSLISVICFSTFPAIFFEFSAKRLAENVKRLVWNYIVYSQKMPFTHFCRRDFRAFSKILWDWKTFLPLECFPVALCGGIIMFVCLLSFPSLFVGLFVSVCWYFCSCWFSEWLCLVAICRSVGESGQEIEVASDPIASLNGPIWVPVGSPLKHSEIILIFSMSRPPSSPPEKCANLSGVYSETFSNYYSTQILKIFSLF